VKKLGGETDEIQTDAIHPTGTVEVLIDKDGQAKFDIKQSVAWDFLEWSSNGARWRNGATRYALGRWHSALRSRAKRSNPFFRRLQVRGVRFLT